MEESEFQEFMRRAREGDDRAIGALLAAFEKDVRVMVRIRLPRLLRREFDSMDFVQSAWKSFLDDSRIQGSQFMEIEQFRKYLMGVARFKVLEEYRRRTRSQGYDMTREEPLYVHRGDRDELKPVASTSPSPSQEAVADECLEQLTAGRPGSEAEILRLRGQNLTFLEIARRVATSERTVRRVIEDARGRLERRDARAYL